MGKFKDIAIEIHNQQTFTATRRQWHKTACDLYHRKMRESGDVILLALDNNPNRPYWKTPDDPEREQTITVDAGMAFDLRQYYMKYHNFPQQ